MLVSDIWNLLIPIFGPRSFPFLFGHDCSLLILGMRNDEWITVVFLSLDPTWMVMRNQTHRKDLIVSRSADKPFDSLRPRRKIIIAPFEFAVGNFADTDLTILCRSPHRLPKR